MDKYLAPLYFVFAAVFLTAECLQGFSWLDIGMYMSGYEHFSQDPYAISYLGLWALTYQLGGAILQALPGYWGLRTAHVLWVLLVQLVVYLYLKRFIAKKPLLLGLLIATLAQFGSYSEICYNDFSSGSLVFILLLYHHGLRTCRFRWFAGAGFLLAFAVWFRIVNLTFLCIPLWAIVLTHRFPGHAPWKTQLRGFFSGLVAGVLCSAIYFRLTGLHGIILQTLTDIFKISGAHDDSHGAKQLFISIYTIYKEVLAGISLVVLIAWLGVLGESRWRGVRRRLMEGGILALCMLHVYFWESPANITIGLALVATVFCLLQGRRDEVAMLLLFSLFVPLVYPLGSNGGQTYLGIYLCFFPLPLAMSVILDPNGALPCLDTCACRRAVRVVLSGICLAMLYTNIFRPMLEDGNRVECRYAIDSHKTQHILTTASNADLHNRHLRALRPHVKPGSYLICNYSLPMISLLDCKPYGVFSDIFTSNNMNRRYLDIAFNRAATPHCLPYLLLNEDNMTEGFAFIKAYCMGKRPYSKVWSEGTYALYMPL